MKKSDFLDDLRLEIGLAYDYACDQEDFIVRIMNVIYAAGQRNNSLRVYQCSGTSRRLIYSIGREREKTRKAEFGDGFLFGDRENIISHVQRGQETVLHIPIFDKEKPAYLITFCLHSSEYTISRQDMIFAQEIVHFIESRQSMFH
ncbi:hypothetical protein [Alkalicoccus urumqiensis]|uniref:GAF domain-containing protein n=1 Tax=Alkalicoccus urumqiensis TaxID=1548213 RepID=A0A2P6MER5_ALKUR|nr:hypothetical protein [Alkalicoccus urumqiensis]PRO64768.1 hypothetical protein C6I21_12725 [Alkalicoccus urumqiensis]